MPKNANKDTLAVEPEVQAPNTSKVETEGSQPDKKLKTIDIVAIVVVTVIVAVLGWTLYSKLQLKHEVSQAQTVSDKVVAAMAKQDTETVRKLGDKQFQAKNTAASLSQNLTSKPESGSVVTFAQLYGKSKPTIDQRIVTNSSDGQHVAFIYRYDTLKVPLFVRVGVVKTSGSDKWVLQNLSVSPDESKLLGQ